MSLARLLNQPLSLSKMGGSTKDAYGNAAPAVVGTPAQIVGYIEQKKSDEYLTDRDVAVTEYHLYVPSGTNVNQFDRVTYGGVTYEIDGAPWQVYNPRTQAVSHLQASLKVVT